MSGTKDWVETTMMMLSNEDFHLEVVNAYILANEDSFLEFASEYLPREHPEEFGND